MRTLTDPDYKAEVGNIGDGIRLRRKKAGMTQDDLAGEIPDHRKALPEVPVNLISLCLTPQQSDQSFYLSASYWMGRKNIYSRKTLEELIRGYANAVENDDWQESRISKQMIVIVQSNDSGLFDSLAARRISCIPLSGSGASRISSFCCPSSPSLSIPIGAISIS